MKKVLPFLLLVTIPWSTTLAAETWLDGEPAGLLGPGGQEALPLWTRQAPGADVPIRLPEVDPREVIPVSTTAPLENLAQDEDYFTLDELKAEMKKLAWTKGDFKIVPCGAFWADMIYATDRNNPGAYTLYIPSRDEQGEDSLTIDERRSRFGLDVTGPRIPFFNCAESGGRVEIDFHGSFFSTENRASILLRHAYWEVKNENFKALVGQTWDLISPLYPGTLNYSVGWDGGNMGYRRPQFRYDRYYGAHNRLGWQWALALTPSIADDLPGDPNDRRESVDWPVIQGRVGCTLRDAYGRRGPITLGVSGHIGQTGFDFLDDSPPGRPGGVLPAADDQRFNTWSFNIDARIPITARLGVEGEFFTGANLGPYLGGIGQGVCPCLRVPIRSTGGWVDVWYDWTPRWHSYAGMGIDDPRDDDSLVGRVYNHFIFANLVFDVTKNLNTGIEVTSWKTLYHDTRVGVDLPPVPTAPGESVTIDWMVKYAF